MTQVRFGNQRGRIYFCKQFKIKFYIDKTFGGKYDFYMTGIYEGTKAEQLANFRHQLEKYSGKEIKQPKSWMDAWLEEYLETKKHKNRILV